MNKWIKWNEIKSCSELPPLVSGCFLDENVYFEAQFKSFSFYKKVVLLSLNIQFFTFLTIPFTVKAGMSW